jgi:hypothetical protein
MDIIDLGTARFLAPENDVVPVMGEFNAVLFSWNEGENVIAQLLQERLEER